MWAVRFLWETRFHAGMARQALGIGRVVHVNYAHSTHANPGAALALILVADFCDAPYLHVPSGGGAHGRPLPLFVNQHVFQGVEALTPVAVLWINLPGVWGVGLLSIYAAPFGGVGWGLSMVYLVLVNAVAHVVAAILWREYNPGLWTALALFVPGGTLALVAISGVAGAERIHHAVGLAVGIGIHAAIVVHTRGKAKIISQSAG